MAGYPSNVVRCPMPCSASPTAVVQGRSQGRQRVDPLGRQAGLMGDPATAGGRDGGNGGSSQSGGGGGAAALGGSSPAGGRTGSSAAGSGPAAGQVGAASGNGAAACEVETTLYGSLPVPAAAKPWFLLHDSNNREKLPVTVYSRRPDGTVKQHSVILNIAASRGWRLTGIVPLVNHLGMHGGDRVRLTREEGAAAGGGAAAGCMVVVVEKVAGGKGPQGQRYHRRRHVRTAIRIGTSYAAAAWGQTLLS